MIVTMTKKLTMAIVSLVLWLLILSAPPPVNTVHTFGLANELTSADIASAPFAIQSAGGVGIFPRFVFGSTPQDPARSPAAPSHCHYRKAAHTPTNQGALIAPPGKPYRLRAGNASISVVTPDVAVNASCHLSTTQLRAPPIC